MIKHKEFQESCTTCHLSQVCIPESMNENEVTQLDNLVNSRIKLKKKDRKSVCCL